MANVLDLVGRIFISALFLISAFNKIFKQLKSKRVVTLFSSHAEEEKMFADIYKVLSKDVSNLFFIIICNYLF